VKPDRPQVVGDETDLIERAYGSRHACADDAFKRFSIDAMDKLLEPQDYLFSVAPMMDWTDRGEK
jgi:hypothetical protein